MTGQIKFVAANEEHAEGISKVICDAIRRVNAEDYPAAEIGRLVSNFSTFHVLDFLKKRLTIVALSDNEVVGTGSLQDYELKSLFVTPDLHRRGIGSTLVAELEKAASERGLRELKVSSSLSAIKFYSSLGYVEESRQFFGEEETVVMVKTKISP
ncbi:hypothetical protein RA27_00355 [Ruegeria sp. ANG-R]|uniref:GNAT family N-acetyltransferase n=1 Tax=Ruegeria sp. ANG-R TaxID=1577903 RepID=UPI000580A66F|nr:GNAT family N-acetyltransferase [Ruegeria sp. ANG-R]KIC41904.1 hypothetical protein RA27_00355 [Ruegeria sp. ANG-R]